MKKENSTLSKRLKQYSAMAGSMVAVAGVAHGQVVYTDIPDTVFTAAHYYPGDAYGLDLNNDGITDFNFRAWASSSSSVFLYRAFGLIMNPYSTLNPNGILGTVPNTTSGNPLGMVDQLTLNDDIGSNEVFFKYPQISFQSSSAGPHFHKYPLMISAATSGTIGNWQAGETDHYAGLRFNIGAETHYGWVRLDVAPDASSITIKDYAYNATADDPLFAGQGSPLGVSSANQPGNFNILGYEGVVNIFVNDGKPDGCTATVTNMLGETIIRQPLSNRTTRLDLNQFAKGIYLVTVQRGDETFSKKVSFR